jgi:selenophosphate synthetase-related protein
VQASAVELVEAVRASPGWRSKSHIGVVGDVFGDVFGTPDWREGPGDDGAVVRSSGESLIVCGEAILPAFFERDPFGAGIAAVLTNVNDVAAMGAVPLAVVDTLVGDETTCRTALEGMRQAAGLYDVPVVGGHLTIDPDRYALSAFALGRCPGPPLAAASVRPGDRLGLLGCLEGTMRSDFPFFPSFDERGGRLAGDVRLLASLAETGSCTAAKDVSMAGLLGSLAMLLEPTTSGVTVSLDDIPVPAGVDLLTWLICFPCLVFLVCGPPDREAETAAAAASRGLTYAPLGTIDDSGVLAVRDSSAHGPTVTVVDLGVEGVTRLAPLTPRVAPDQRDARRPGG